ncbi:MAG: hypothetical protein ACYDAA_17080 [Syntrophales bacterium]
MPTQAIAMIMRVFSAILLVGLISAALTAAHCRGSERAADPTITLDVQNEPLRTVLEKISRTTKWKIIVPDRWMDKPITQTLDKVPLEEGLRFILKDAGIENLLLTYDEERKTVALYDTELQPGRSANHPPAQGEARPPLVSPPVNQSDPLLSRPAEAQGSAPRRTSRGRYRRHPESTEE